MQVKTWLQRLTDESNLWFNAVKAEDDGNLEDAISYYIKDALECARQRSLVRSALSCSCAANCLAKMGAWSPACMLYSEAARIYVENSELAMSESIREALWSLQEAFENYALAGDSAADAVRERYVALATRTSPFSRADKVAKDLKLHKTEPVTYNSKEEASITDDLSKKIEGFMKARKDAVARIDTFDPGYILKSINMNGGSRLNEKSIVS